MYKSAAAARNVQVQSEFPWLTVSAQLRDSVIFANAKDITLRMSNKLFQLSQPGVITISRQVKQEAQQILRQHDMRTVDPIIYWRPNMTDFKCDFGTSSSCR